MWLCESGGFNRTKGDSVESQTDRTWKIFIYLFTMCGICFSDAKSCPTLCNHLNCSTPGFPVLHYLPEFAQTHVHWVSDAIQPSHPLSPPSLFTLSLSQHHSPHRLDHILHIILYFVFFPFNNIFWTYFHFTKCRFPLLFWGALCSLALISHHLFRQSLLLFRLIQVFCC